MRRTWMAGAIGALAWTASCVSILGVDSDDYQDIDEAICSCSAAPTLCAGVVEAFLKDQDRGEAITACVEDSRTCQKLDECLVASDICSAEGRSCSQGGQLQLRCCGDLACVQGKCEAAACPELGQGCDGACCEGLTCEDGTCCRGEGAECSVNGECCGGSSCLRGRCAPCGELTEGCSEDAEGSTTCCDGVACSDTGYCLL